MVLDVLVFMLSLNCSMDFRPNFWGGFDTAMLEEWNITTITNCYQVDKFPSNYHDYENLENTLSNVENSNDITITQTRPVNFTTYIDKILLNQNLIDLQERQHKQVVFLTKYSKSVFQRDDAAGISYPSENIAFVRNNYFYSTGTLSHEILHLVLKEEGYPKSCYVDKVHENQFKFSLKQIGDQDYPIIAKFNC
jgi:hypothetical protein